MSKIQIIIISIIIILLTTVYFKKRYKKPLVNNKNLKLLTLIQYNKIGSEMSCESLQYLVNLFKNLLKKLSLIFWINFFIYKKYKYIGRFLNNNNYNKLVNFFLIILMFLIDNVIL